MLLSPLTFHVGTSSNHSVGIVIHVGEIGDDEKIGMAESRQDSVRFSIQVGCVRDGGSSNTRLDLDRAHSYDVGVLQATLTYYSNSKRIVVLMKIRPGG